MLATHTPSTFPKVLTNGRSTAIQMGGVQRLKMMGLVGMSFGSSGRESIVIQIGGGLQ